MNPAPPVTSHVAIRTLHKNEPTRPHGSGGEAYDVGPQAAPDYDPKRPGGTGSAVGAVGISGSGL